MQHLGGHPEYRTFHVGSLAETVICVGRLFRNTEIGYLADTVQIDENVVTLEITVPNVLLVEVGQTVEDLSSEVFDEFSFESSLIWGPVDGGDGSTWNIF